VELYFIRQKQMNFLFSVAELGINPDHIVQKVSVNTHQPSSCGK